VAQRRKRVFVVASARADFDPAAVLFEFDGVRRDTAPSREAGETVAPTIAGCANGGGENGPGRDVDSVDSLQIYQLANTLTARMHKGMNSTLDKGQTPVISIQDVTPREKSQNGKGWSDDGTIYTVDTHATQGVMQAIAFSRNDDGRDATTDLSPTMRVAGRAGGMLGVAQPIPIDTMNHVGRGDHHSFGDFEPGAPSYTLTKGHSHAVATAMQVRRLTPVECERLQGFPDGYTEIPWRKKPAIDCPDGPRYKALGNSWAVPVVRWIGKRIETEIKCKPNK
jgi:DNA (cytosine-5)-methyltransferase 1